MKKITYLYLLLSFLISDTFAQIKDVKISELKAPSAPAFTILGINPSEVSRPKDLNSLELSLLNAVSSNGSFAIPNSYALEVTPYWLTSQNVTFAQLETENDLAHTFVRTLSISVAAAQRDNLVDPTIKVNQIGLGFRSYLLNGRLADLTIIKKPITTINILEGAISDYTPLINLAKAYIDHNPPVGFTPDQYKNFLLELLNFPLNKIKTSSDPGDVARASAFEGMVLADKNKQKQIIQIYSQVIKGFINNSVVVDDQDAKGTLEDLKSKITDFYNTSESLTSAVNKVKEFRQKRIGWMLEVAGALNLATLKNNQQLSGSKSGFWFTLTHRPEKVYGFEFIGLLRYLNDRNEILNANNFDGGVKAVFDQGQFFISVESVNRTSTTFTNIITSNNFTTGSFNTVNGWRWGVNIGYRITPAIVIAGSFGKAFESDIVNKGGYLSLLDVNFGFGRPTTTIK